MSEQEQVAETTEAQEARTEQTVPLSALHAERSKRQELEGDEMVQAALLAKEAGLTPGKILEMASNAMFGAEEQPAQESAQQPAPEVVQQLQQELTRVSAKLASIENTTMEEKVNAEISAFASAHAAEGIKPGTAAWKAIGMMAFAGKMSLEDAYNEFKASTNEVFNKGRETGQQETSRKREAATEGRGSSREAEFKESGDPWADVVRKLGA